jgi:hypothetical protein
MGIDGGIDKWGRAGGTPWTADFTPLSWQLDGEGGEDPAAENGLFLRVRISGGAGRLGTHGPGREPLPGSVPAGKVRCSTSVG